MGILDKFKTPKSSELKNGSEFAPKYDAKAGDVPKSKLTGVNSPLHADQDGNEGYSLNGTILDGIDKLYSEYDDGVVNALPPSSKLDDASNDPKFPLKYTSGKGKTYEENPPE